MKLNAQVWVFAFGLSLNPFKPPLELVEQQCGCPRLRHLKKKVDARHVGPGVAFAKPFSLCELALRMTIEQDLP
jgi:hypothetical protein